MSNTLKPATRFVLTKHVNGAALYTVFVVNYNFRNTLNIALEFGAIFQSFLLPRLTYFTNGEFLVFPHILIGGQASAVGVRIVRSAMRT